MKHDSLKDWKLYYEDIRQPSRNLPNINGLARKLEGLLVRIMAFKQGLKK